MLWVCNVMLSLNVVWDAVSVAAIWATFCVKDVGDLEAATVDGGLLKARLAELHTSMWARNVDTHNHAACMLMAWWVLTLGCLRALGLLGGVHWLLLAALSYALEGLAFFVEAIKSTMVPRKACPASLFSFFCMAICLATAKASNK
jgi:hypothetical protein